MVLKKYGILTGNKWYSHIPNVVTGRDDGKVTIYLDKPIKTNRKVTYNRPDVVVIDMEEKTWYTVDFVIAMDHHVKENEEKTDKYMYFAAEFRMHFRVKTVIVMITLSPLLEKLEIEDIIGSLQLLY